MAVTATTPSRDGLRLQRLFGLDFVADATIPEITDVLVAEASDPNDEWRCVVTPNVDHLVRYDRIESEATTARHATMLLPDGMPIIWAGRLLRRPMARRLAGSDLMGELWPRLAEHGIPAVVIASSVEVSDGLRASHPDIRCVVPPMFDPSDEQAVDELIDRVDADVAAIGARFLVVGVSMPKHHLIANRLRSRWGDDDRAKPTVLLLGASPDLFLGLTPRAPRWMQTSGLEWLYRLAREPRRLARRYLIDDVAFVRLVYREWRLLRRSKPVR